MRIRIEMTSEEVTKSAELATAISPSIDVSEYIPTERQTVEVKCNAYETTNTYDPETGIVTDIEIKTHFVVWILRKMKPFIAAIISLWHMFADFYEDIRLMMGDVTILHNGEDLADKLSKMAEETEYMDNEDDECVDRDSNSITMSKLYVVHYEAETFREIESEYRFFFTSESEANAIVNDGDYANYKRIHHLYCLKPYTCDIDEMLRADLFEYRGYTIEKDTDDKYVVIIRNRRVEWFAKLTQALSYIDFNIDMAKLVYRVYTSDKNNRANVNRIFYKMDNAKEYMDITTQYKTKLIFFNVPANFDFHAPTAAYISYKGYDIIVNNNSSATVIIDNQDNLFCDIFKAMNYIDDIEVQ